MTEEETQRLANTTAAQMLDLTSTLKDAAQMLCVYLENNGPPASSLEGHIEFLQTSYDAWQELIEEYERN